MWWRARLPGWSIAPAYHLCSNHKYTYMCPRRMDGWGWDELSLWYLQVYVCVCIQLICHIRVHIYRSIGLIRIQTFTHLYRKSRERKKERMKQEIWNAQLVPPFHLEPREYMSIFSPQLSMRHTLFMNEDFYDFITPRSTQMGICLKVWSKTSNWNGNGHVETVLERCEIFVCFQMLFFHLIIESFCRISWRNDIERKKLK